MNVKLPRHLLKALLEVASDDVERVNLYAVNVEGDALTSTDGHRALIVRAGGEPAEGKVQVQRAGLDAALRLAQPARKEWVYNDFEGSYRRDVPSDDVVITDEGGTLRARVGDATVPLERLGTLPPPLLKIEADARKDDREPVRHVSLQSKYLGVLEVLSPHRGILPVWTWPGSPEGPVLVDHEDKHNDTRATYILMPMRRGAP